MVPAQSEAGINMFPQKAQRSGLGAWDGRAEGAAQGEHQSVSSSEREPG